MTNKVAYSTVPDHPLLLHTEPQFCRDTDCACAERPFDTAFPQLLGAGQSYAQAAAVFACDLPLGWRTIMSPYAPHGPSVINAAGWQRWQTYARPQPLAQPFDAELAGELLLYPTGMPLIPSEPPADKLTVWLHVTNACNLDCPYCYVRKSSHYMREDAGRAAIYAACAAAREQGMHTLKLKYAGGEASLRFGLIQSLHAYATAAAHSYGLALEEVLLTNGTLLDENSAAWCLAAGVKLMVSLDGVGEVHNRLRPWRNGADSFAQVEHTVDNVLLPLGLRPDISMTVTRANAGGAAAVARWALIDRRLPLSFNLYRANSLTSTRRDLALEETEIVQGLLAAYRAIEEHLPAEPFLDGLIDRGHLHAHRHTCGVGRSYLVIDHNGSVSQCQMHLAHATPLPPAQELLPLVAAGTIRNLSVDEKEGCRSCSFRYRCTGGCPIETLRATGRWDVQSPNCNIYQALWPAALRLEGLRLLKTNGLLH